MGSLGEKGFRELRRKVKTHLRTNTICFPSTFTLDNDEFTVCNKGHVYRGHSSIGTLTADGTRLESLHSTRRHMAEWFAMDEGSVERTRLRNAFKQHAKSLATPLTTEVHEVRVGDDRFLLFSDGLVTSGMVKVGILSADGRGLVPIHSIFKHYFGCLVPAPHF